MKIKVQFFCRECGHQSMKWLGRCPSCEAWSSFVEETIVPESKNSRQGQIDQELLLDKSSGKNWVPLEGEKGEEGNERETKHAERYQTGIGELDRVLGGGLVRDSFVLIGGDPGIGKSTLLLQAARGLIEKNPNLKILYASGEESIEQIRDRARRLGIKSDRQIYLASETLLERVYTSVKEIKPQVLVIDSIQTFSTHAVDAVPGSVSQIREVTARLMTLAKSAGICVWLVGHVTKDGAIAGPKVVEHMVDTVLYFDTEEGQSYRLLRTIKNRFGSSRELGIFEMETDGLREIPNPSSLFLSERKEPVTGTAVSALIEGSRTLLVELQALVTPSGLAMPRRTSVGLESARFSLVAAILEKHMGLKLATQDLFFNVAGGLKLTEPACDLAVAAAIWSSDANRSFNRDCLFLGELGLTGEVRRISQPETRVEEAYKMGFKTAVVPKSSLDRLEKYRSKYSEMKFIPISTIGQLSKING